MSAAARRSWRSRSSGLAAASRWRRASALRSLARAAAGVPEVGGAGVPLHVGELLVGGRDLFRELGIARSVYGQRVEVLGRPLQEERPRRGGSGQGLDLLVHLEDERVREAAGVLESLLGADAIGLGQMGLARAARKPRPRVSRRRGPRARASDARARIG